MNPKFFFEKKLNKLIQNKKKDAEFLKCNYKFIIKGENGGIWQLLCKNSPPTIKKGDGKSDCTLIINEKDFRDIIEKKITPQVAFLKRKLKIIGNIKFAIRLGSLM